MYNMTVFGLRSRSRAIKQLKPVHLRAKVKVVQGRLKLFLLTQQYLHTKPLTGTIHFSLSSFSHTCLSVHLTSSAHEIISQDTINITRNVSLLINLEQPLGTY